MDPSIVVAMVTGSFGLATGIATVVVQAKVHRDNRSDHAQTAAKVDQLVAVHGDLAADMRDVKADVRSVKEDNRHIRADVAGVKVGLANVSDRVEKLEGARV